MKLLFDYKKINKVNFFLLLLYVAVIIGFIVKNYAQKNNYNGVAKSVTQKTKYNVTNTDITTTNGEVVSVKLQRSFFDAGSFLNIQQNDSLSYYKNTSGEVIGITNITKDATLGIVYFTIRSLTGFQYLILVLLLFYNVIQLLNLRALNKLMVSKENQQKETRLETLNNLTKKYFLLTAVILAIVIYFFASLAGIIKNNQSNLQDFSLYKYLIVFLAFLIPVPFIIKNYLLLKKLNHSINP